MNYYMEYDTPIKFKGDIIITDPCYLMRDANNSICREFYPKSEYPNDEDYFLYGTNEFDYPDIIEQEITLTNSLEDKDKAFWYCCSGAINASQYMNLRRNVINELTFNIKCSPMYQTAKKKYDEAVEKHYATPHDDWDLCNCGDSMEKLGFTQSAVASTLYGDWGCHTFEILDEVATAKPEKLAEKPLGEFCADSGLVGVFLVDEVMKYNPEAVKELKEQNWCATFIDGFDGEITFAKVKETWTNEETGEEYEDEALHLVGNGNIKFITGQTSL